MVDTGAPDDAVALLGELYLAGAQLHDERPTADRDRATGPSLAAAAAARFEEFTATGGAQYPAIVALWRNAWLEFVPFLDHDEEIRRVICSTNAIEPVNARYRRAVRARGHFPTEQPP